METQWFKEISQINMLTCDDGDDVWFVSDKYSLIFQMYMKNNCIRRIIRIEDEEFATAGKCYRLEKSGEKLVLISFNSDKITLFHTDKNTFRYIYLRKSLVNCLNSVIVANVLYLIDEYEIIAINMEEEKVLEYISIPVDGTLTSRSAFLIGGHIIIPLVFQPGIIDFFIAEKSFRYFELEGGGNGFVTGVADGMDVWLAGDKGNIIQWNYGSKKTSVFDKPPKGFCTYNYDVNGNFIPWNLGWVQGVSFQYWYDCFSLNDRIWFVPQMSDSLLYIEKNHNLMQKYTFENEYETKRTAGCHRLSKFLLVGIYKKRYIKIYSVKRDVIYCIDDMSLEYTEENICIADADKDGIENEYWVHLDKKAVQTGLIENKNLSIEELIALLNKKDADYGSDRMEQQVGKNIYMCC